MSNAVPENHTALSTVLGDGDDVVKRLATLESEPLADRVRMLSDVHEQLSNALSELDHL